MFMARQHNTTIRALAIIGIPTILQSAYGGAVHGMKHGQNRYVMTISAESRVTKLFGDKQAKRRVGETGTSRRDPLGVQMLHNACHRLFRLERQLKLGIVTSLDQQRRHLLSTRH